MFKQQQLFLFSLLCFLFYCSSYSAQKEKNDKEFLRNNLNTKRLQKFLTQYPHYVNKSFDKESTVSFHDNQSLAFFLILQSHFGLATIMAQHGDKFNDALKISTNSKNLGSTPLIVLAFIRSKNINFSKKRLCLIQSILRNNPYAFLDKRDDGMTPYLIASIQGDLPLMNILEETCAQYNSGWLAELQRQRTKESFNNTTIDFLKYSISKATELKAQEELLSKFIGITNSLLHDPGITREEFDMFQQKFRNSVEYLEHHSKKNPSLKDLLEKNTAYLK